MGGRTRALRGVNVCYLRGDYGHDLAPNPRFPNWPVSFEALASYRPLIEARELGFEAARFWLCENAEGIIVEDGEVAGVHGDLLEAVEIVQEAAHLHGVKLYFSLLDGNAWPREGDPVTRSILADAAQAERFAELVVRPLCARLDPDLVIALEIVNEPETATSECMVASESPLEPIEWAAIGRAIKICGDAARAEEDLLISAGTGHVFLPSLWRAEPALDLVDVHIYHPTGGLPSREHLAEYVGDERLLDERLPLIVGEAGIPKEPGVEESAMCNFIYNADQLGYDAVFLWQLDGSLRVGEGRTRSTTPLGEAVRHTLKITR